MTLGEKIQNLRKSNALSQEQLAEKILVSRQAISKWELNEASPDISNIILLSKTFNVSTDYLLNENYLCEKDTPAVKNTEISVKNEYAIKKRKTLKVLGTIFLCVGLAGILTIWILSSFIPAKKMVQFYGGEYSNVSIEESSEETFPQDMPYYKPVEVFEMGSFITTYNLGAVFTLAFTIFLAGIIMLFIAYKGDKQKSR